MTYDFIAILDQDVPRCRSWVRFMGPKCFTRSWGLGWGGHRRTYLSLTGVGSACNRPDRLERSLAKIQETKGASSQGVKNPESRRSRRSSCQTTESRIAPRSRCLHPPGACGSSDCREMAQPSESDASLRLGLALPRRTPVAQGGQRTLQDLARRAPRRNRQQLASPLIVVNQWPGALLIGTHPHPYRVGAVVLTLDQPTPAPIAHFPTSGWAGADVIDRSATVAGPTTAQSIHDLVKR